MNLDAFVFVKPEAYKKMDSKAVEEVLKADQRVLSNLETLINKGEEQIKAKTTYTNDHLPEESPTRTIISLDGIEFKLITNAKVNNPSYQTVFDKITTFLEDTLYDWEENIRKDGIRTYTSGETKEKVPFIRWDYLMSRILKHLSNITYLGVENKFEEIKAPKEYDKMKLETLTVPVNLIKDFKIEKPGAAKVWYLSRRFYNEVQAKTKAPIQKEMVDRTEITEEKMPQKTQEYLEQFEKYIYSLKTIPSPRRQPSQAIDRLFLIPQKDKPKGSTALPTILQPDNYIQLLEEYRPILPTSLKKWKKLDGKIGELVVFYYGIEKEPRVQEEFPFLPSYELIRDGDKMFVSLPTLYGRMMALEKDYETSRLLRKHTIIPLL